MRTPIWGCPKFRGTSLVPDFRKPPRPPPFGGKVRFLNGLGLGWDPLYRAPIVGFLYLYPP